MAHERRRNGKLEQKLSGLSVSNGNPSHDHPGPALAVGRVVHPTLLSDTIAMWLCDSCTFCNLLVFCLD